MDHNDLTAMAARNLTEGATLEELREAARDLRALSPESALADLVEAKIERILAESEQTDIGAEATRPAHPERLRTTDGRAAPRSSPAGPKMTSISHHVVVRLARLSFPGSRPSCFCMDRWWAGNPTGSTERTERVALTGSMRLNPKETRPLH